VQGSRLVGLWHDLMISLKIIAVTNISRENAAQGHQMFRKSSLQACTLSPTGDAVCCLIVRTHIAHRRRKS
jgi:hypothetical protein